MPTAEQLNAAARLARKLERLEQQEERAVKRVRGQYASRRETLLCRHETAVVALVEGGEVAED